MNLGYKQSGGISGGEGFGTPFTYMRYETNSVNMSTALSFLSVMDKLDIIYANHVRCIDIWHALGDLGPEDRCSDSNNFYILQLDMGEFE